MNRQRGLAPILIVILIALVAGGYLIYTNYSNNRYKTVQSTPVPTSSSTPTSSDETTNWKTYHDWQSNRFSFKYPENWYLHSEIIKMDSNKSFRDNMRDLPFDSYSEKYENIQGKEVLIRDVIDAGMAYGRVIEARIPYNKDSYIWFTAKKVDKVNKDKKYTDAEINEFVKILDTLIISKQ